MSAAAGRRPCTTSSSGSTSLQRTSAWTSAPVDCPRPPKPVSGRQRRAAINTTHTVNVAIPVGLSETLPRVPVFPRCEQCLTRPTGGSVTWRSEYRRVVQTTPCFLTDELRDHDHQVLHVSFSHDGRHFATCSKDGYVLVSASSADGRQSPAAA